MYLKSCSKKKQIPRIDIEKNLNMHTYMEIHDYIMSKGFHADDGDELLLHIFPTFFLTERKNGKRKNLSW